MRIYIGRYVVWLLCCARKLYVFAIDYAFCRFDRAMSCEYMPKLRFVYSMTILRILHQLWQLIFRFPDGKQRWLSN
jgi:hypothetical protein